MQISVENTSPLGRRLRVSVPEERLSTEVDQRLQGMTGKTRVQGFRRGKVPLRVIRQRFGKQVRDEVVNDVLGASMRDALAREQLQPAGQVELLGVETAPGSGLRFSIGFDVYPEVQLQGLQDLRIAQPTVQLGEQDIDTAVAELREQHRTLEDAGRPAAHGDVLLLELRARPALANILPAGETMVKLGENPLGAQFDSQLLGLQAGQQTRFDLSFSASHGNEQLRGRDVHFDVRVKRVLQASLPSLDETFFSYCGIKEGGLAAFRDEVRRSLERKVGMLTRQYLRKQLQQQLCEHYPQQLPERLLRQREAGLQKDMQGGVNNSGALPELEAGPAGPDRMPVAERARFMLTLEIIYRHVQRDEQIDPDQARIRRYVEDWAQLYKNSTAMINAVYANPDYLQRLRNLCLDECIEDHLLRRVQLQETPMNITELSKRVEQP